MALKDEIREYHKSRMPIPPNDQVKDALKKMMEEREKFSDADSKDGKELLSMYINQTLWMKVHLYIQYCQHNRVQGQYYDTTCTTSMTTTTIVHTANTIIIAH